MKLLRVSAEFLVQEVVDGARRIGDAELRDVNEKLTVQGAAADEDWKIVAAAVGEGVADADFFALDDGWEGDHVADGLVAGGITDVANFEIVDREALAGIKWAFRSEKRECELVVRGEADVARPN